MKTICSACQREANEKEAPPGWLWVCPACGAKAAEVPGDSTEGAAPSEDAAIAPPSAAAGPDGQDDADVDVDVDMDLGADAPAEMPRVSLAPISLDDTELLSVPPPAFPPPPPNPRPVPAARISGPASARRLARANPTQSAPVDEPARPQSFAARLASKAFAQDPTPEVSQADSAAAAARAAAAAKTAREEERLPDSGLFDIRSMIAKPRGNAKQATRVNEDILNLSGGLFSSSATSTPLAPLIAPDLRALEAPRPSQREVVAPAAPPREPREVAARPPVRDESDVDAIAAPRGGRMKLVALAVVALGLMGGAFMIVRGDASSSGEKTSTPVEAQAAVAERPSSPIPPVAAADPSPRPASKPVEEPSIDDGDSKGKTKGPEKAPPASDTKPLAAGATAPAKTTTGATGATGATPTPAAPKPAAPPPAVTVAPPAEGQPFNVGAASAALGAAAGQAAGCKAPGDPSGSARISVTFAASGRATSANVNGPPFAGTPTGSCIASIFRRATVPPFSGSSVTVNKSVAIR